MRSMSIAPPAEHVREDGPLGHGSRGSARAVALEQLALRSDDLCDLQASSRGTGFESRLTTEDLFEVREGLRFDSRGLRTLSSSKWMKFEGPTSLETDLDVESDSVVVPRAPTVSSARSASKAPVVAGAPRTRPTPFIFAASRSSPPRKSRVWTRAATSLAAAEI